MEIPHTVTARPDTGLYNAKLAIWLFLASEVMLFGGLFSAYVFLRMGADDGYWPHGLLNVPIGTINTIILVSSSITIVLAWASLKMRQWARHKMYLGITIGLGVLFLGIKLGNEYPAKFDHFGVFIKKDKWAQYEQYLDNDGLKKKGLPPRPEISGHLHEVEVDLTGADRQKFDDFLLGRGLEKKPAEGGENANVYAIEVKSPRDAEALRKAPGVKVVGFKLALDEVNADPTNVKFDHPSFFLPGHTEKIATIHGEDVDWWSAFYPKHSAYFSAYFLITGLHGLHVLGGIVVFTYFFFFGHKIYRRNPEQQANRIEVVGLYWHFVDLVWIFVFPIFYLL